ncbi:MAG TPA: type II toxin-antitoxin system VapC family toxin [Xanthobacteraceae bacterium]|nr:type II toxin-antitoxin system VapC family toxin [Xanthobacteraceae bacterium]
MVASVKGDRIYLDANVFISAYESRGPRSDSAWTILEAVEKEEFSAVSSELTLAEILVGPIRDGDDKLASRYHEMFQSGEHFLVAPVERDVLIEAAALRGIVGSLRLPDAIHVATARLQECKFVVSDDRRLPTAPGLVLVRLDRDALRNMRDRKP